MRYHYTDSELKEIMQSLVVLVDTREKNNDNIVNYFDKRGIAWKSKALSYGDYSCKIPANEKLGIMHDLYFTDDIVVERKASLEELSGNLSQERKRFENELIRADKTKIMLMIEHGNYNDLVNGYYDTGFNKKAFLAALATFCFRFNFTYHFVTRETAGNFIYWHLFYAVRCKLLGGLANG